MRGSVPVLKFALQRGEKGGNANFKTKHTEPLTQEIPSALYCSLKVNFVGNRVKFPNQSKKV